MCHRSFECLGLNCSQRVNKNQNPPKSDNFAKQISEVISETNPHNKT